LVLKAPYRRSGQALTTLKLSECPLKFDLSTLKPTLILFIYLDVSNVLKRKLELDKDICSCADFFKSLGTRHDKAEINCFSFVMADSLT
ncbi:hypothetical protein ACM2QB_18445, partial [Enterococcus faecium]|uniref:hypothetical protein n=1 Tax=Enterococcus faecium TaxID=1352 RepID=UPI0039FC4690